MKHKATPDFDLLKAQELAKLLKEEHGYLDSRVLDDGTVAVLQDLLFTRALVLGCNRDGWSSRFCFENRDLANQRFRELKTEDDVPEGHIANRSFSRPRDT
jgi:hypothetical protein